MKDATASKQQTFLCQLFCCSNYFMILKWYLKHWLALKVMCSFNLILTNKAQFAPLLQKFWIIPIKIFTPTLKIHNWLISQWHVLNKWRIIIMKIYHQNSEQAISQHLIFLWHKQLNFLWIPHTKYFEIYFYK